MSCEIALADAKNSLAFFGFACTCLSFCLTDLLAIATHDLNSLVLSSMAEGMDESGCVALDEFGNDDKHKKHRLSLP